jgi:hypothetical protein
MAAPMGQRLRSVLPWLPYAPALVVLLLYALAYVQHGWAVVTFPYQVDYGEAPELNRAVLIARGEPIYVDWSRPPYQMANYTPLYPALASLAVPFRGADFFAGRLIAFASTLLSAALIGVVVRALGGPLLGAAVGGLLYLSLNPVWNWGAYQRVDALAVALELLGVAVFCAGWVDRRRPWGVWASVPIFVAAAYTRQTVAAGAYACYGYLLFVRPRLALGAITAYAATGLGLFVLFQAGTGGQFWRHIGEGNLNRWSWATVRHYVEPFWGHIHWTAPVAAAGFLSTVLGRRCQVPFLYLVASAATALTIGKIGSNVNYLLQACAALGVVVGVTMGAVDTLSSPLQWLGRHVPGQFRALALVGAHAALALWLLVGVQQLYHVPHGADVGRPFPRAALERIRVIDWPLWRLDPWGARPPGLRERFTSTYLADLSAEERASARRVHEHVSRMPAGDVLSEDMAFTVTTGRRIYVQSFEFTQIAEEGGWSLEPLLEDVRARRFVAVVLRFRLGSDPTWHRERVNNRLIAALSSAYALEAAYGDYFIYRPSPLP